MKKISDTPSILYCKIVIHTLASILVLLFFPLVDREGGGGQFLLEQYFDGWITEELDLRLVIRLVVQHNRVLVFFTSLCPIFSQTKLPMSHPVFNEFK